MNGPGHAITDYGPNFIIWMTFAAPSVIAAVASLVAMARGRRSGEHAAQAAVDAHAIRDQVENDHSTNLRDDLDRIADTQARHGDELRDLRTSTDRIDDKASRIGAELRNENRLRRDADARTNSKVDALSEHVAEVIAKNHPEDAR